MLVLACVLISNLYLFHLIILLNPIFNYSIDLLSFSLDRVTTGRYNFASVIANIAPIGALMSGTGGSALGSVSYVVSSVITQFLDHLRSNLLQN